MFQSLDISDARDIRIRIRMRGASALNLTSASASASADVNMGRSADADVNIQLIIKIGYNTEILDGNAVTYDCYILNTTTAPICFSSFSDLVEKL